MLKKRAGCYSNAKRIWSRNLTFRLRGLPRYSLKTVRAYLLKEAFQQHPSSLLDGAATDALSERVTGNHREAS